VKVILTSDVATLGKSGELKDVADGYARNFLIPKKLAVPCGRWGVSRMAARHREPRGQAQARA
jgi:large subunit ribosomal protein L9